MKLQIIKWCIIIIIVLKAFNVIFNLSFIFSSYKVFTQNPFDKISISTFVTDTALSLVFTISLVYILLSVVAFKKESVFNLKCATRLKRGGIVMLIYSIIKIVQCILNFKLQQESLTSLSINITFLIMSLTILVIAEIITKGSALQEENNLTI